VIVIIPVKLGLYYGDRSTVEKALELADRCSDNDDDESRRTMHRTLLSDLNRVMSIAEEYYERIYVGNLGEKPKKDDFTLLEPVPVSGK
jgi:hypothetical protein